MILGIDVSRYQTTSSYDLTDTAIKFVIARASIGKQADQTFNSHIYQARKYKKLTGAYHFNWSPLPVRDQVEAFIASAGNVDMYALDVEGNWNADHTIYTPPFTKTQAAAFIKIFHELTGKRIGLYMSLSGFYTDVGQDWNWVAYWSSNEPPIHWDIWQFGAYKGEDGNRFDGTVSELKTLVSGEDMSAAINGGGRVLASDFVCQLGAGVQLYRDTDRTPLRKLTEATLVDNFGSLVGDPDWVVVGVRGNYDSDTAWENGLALVPRTAVAGIRAKTEAEKQATAARFATPAPTGTGYTQEQVDAMLAAINDELNEAERQLGVLADQLDAAESTIAGEPERLAAAITADRAKATPVLTVQYPE
jgi:glycosyl hydrolase family 25